MNQAEARRYVREKMALVLEQHTDRGSPHFQPMRDEPALSEVWFDEVSKCAERLRRLNPPKPSP